MRYYDQMLVVAVKSDVQRLEVKQTGSSSVSLASRRRRKFGTMGGYLGLYPLISPQREKEEKVGNRQKVLRWSSGRHRLGELTRSTGTGWLFWR